MHLQPITLGHDSGNTVEVTEGPRSGYAHRSESGRFAVRRRAGGNRQARQVTRKFGLVTVKTPSSVVQRVLPARPDLDVWPCGPDRVLRLAQLPCYGSRTCPQPVITTMTTHYSNIALAFAAAVALAAASTTPVHAQDQSAGDSIRFINPPTLSSSPRVASKLVEVPAGSRLIYISGLVANDAAGKVVGRGDMHAQAKQVFENVRLALAAAGGTFKDVVKLNFYITDMSKADLVRDVRAQYINADAPPASTLVQVSKLAADEYLLEIEAVAAIAPGK